MNNMQAIPTILKENGFFICVYEWEESSQSTAMICVAKKITNFTQQIATINIEAGTIKFNPGFGYKATDRSTYYSTFSKDENKEKFIKDFKVFINKMDINLDCKYGFLYKSLEEIK